MTKYTVGATTLVRECALSRRLVIDPVSDELKSPVTRKALRYWHSQCRDSRIPCRADIDPAKLKSILPNMCMLAVLDGGGDFLFRLLGTRMREFLSNDYTGRRLSEVDALQPSDMLVESFSTCIDTRQPILANTPYVGPKKDIAELEDLILPLSDCGEKVDRLMIVVDFRFKLDDEW